MSRLEQLRKEKNLLQKEVADYLGVERTTYNKLETGETALKGDPIIKLCRFYGVTSDYLLGISDHRYTKSPDSQKQVGVKVPCEKMTLAQRIKQLRKEKGITQEQLAQVIGMERSTVGKYETGTMPCPDILSTMADYFNVSIEYLIGKSDYRYTKDPNLQKQVGVKIPVLGDVAAGVPITAIENIDYDDPDAWEEIPADMADSGEYFALRLKGDSMEPRMLDGDVVIVHEQSDVNSGDTAIVRVNGDDATCKKIKKTSQGMMLIPLNPEYEPMFFTHKEIQSVPVEIIGKVVELRGKFR